MRKNTLIVIQSTLAIYRNKNESKFKGMKLINSSETLKILSVSLIEEKIISM